MFFSHIRQLKLISQLRLGFGLMLLCMMVLLGANLAASNERQAMNDSLIDHLYPARKQAANVIQLVLTIDNEAARYVLSNDPYQQAQLLQSYQHDVQSLRAGIASANALADTQEQRNALNDLTQYFFGKGGYYATNQQIFSQLASQHLTASDGFVRSPFITVIVNDAHIYIDVVNREIVREDVSQDALTALIQYGTIGVGVAIVLFGGGTALFITRSVARLYRQIEEKNARLGESNERLQALSTTDPLTELPNHRALLSTLEQELERTQRHDRTCSLLFLDIDHFKALNDGYGHAAGDIVLQDFARVLSSTIRSMDTAGRWGGEEFVAILPETTGDEAATIAERIRKAVSFHSFAISGGLHLTCSIGVACYPEHVHNQDELIKAADQAMYGAKHLGRNQVRVFSDPALVSLFQEEAARGGREESALRGTADALVKLVEERDRSLGHHSQQVATLSGQLARALGMSPEEAQKVALAGMLHDIGKVAIPDAILLKPGPLTEEEWKQMRRHSIVGADVIDHIPSLRPLVPVIRTHHERWDGGGYPDHLRGEQIPLAARLIAVVDAYTVMLTDRPYQQAIPPEAALAELQRCAGTQFDPHVVEIMACVLQEAQEQWQGEMTSVA